MAPGTSIAAELVTAQAGANRRASLLVKIAELMAFEATAAGAALKRYRSAIQVAVMSDEDDTTELIRRQCWEAVRLAEHELITEIKRLQTGSV